MAAGAGLAVLAGGALSTGATPASAQSAGDPANGAKVFQQGGCSSCHTLAAAGATGKVGPNLDSLKPSFEAVSRQVKAGGGAMPGFEGILTAGQIADVAAYVSQATGGAPASTPAPAPTPTPTAPATGTGPAPTTGSSTPGSSSSPTRATTPAAGTTGSGSGSGSASAGGGGSSAGSGGGQGTATAPAAGGRAARTVTLSFFRDRQMRLSTRQVVAGQTRVVVRNPGRQTHYVALLRTSRALKSLRVRGGWLREPGGVTKVTVRAGRRGQSAALSLAPGRYVFSCRLARHVRRGLRTTLRVVAAPAAQPTVAPGVVPGLGAGDAPAAEASAAQVPATDPIFDEAPQPSGAPATTPSKPSTPATSPNPSEPDETPTTPLPPIKLDGKALFTINCGGCHRLAAAGTTGTIGPSLDDKHPDFDKVVRQVNEGEDPMPSFRGTLTPEQIADIADFVSTAVGRGGR